MTDKVKNMTVCIVMAVFVFAMTVICIIKPDNELSESERRKLITLPEFNKENILDGKFNDSFEDYAKDQFPFREDFRKIKALASTKLFNKGDNNGIYVTGGYASALEYPLDKSSLENVIDKLNVLYERYISDKNMNVYFSIIPDKNYFLAEANGYPAMDYNSLEEMLTRQLSFATYVDIKDLLEVEDYYRTDTHWKQERIVDVADKLKETMNVKSESEYTENVLNHSFYGVYSGQSALNLKPDTIKYLTNEVIDHMKVYDFENSREISVYDMEKAYSADPYEMYLSGSLSLITIANDAADTDKELIIFRDSFGSSIAPLLAESYSKVTLVDIRYLRSDILDRYIDFENQDVLFLYSTMVLNNSETFK